MLLGATICSEGDTIDILGEIFTEKEIEKKNCGYVTICTKTEQKFQKKKTRKNPTNFIFEKGAASEWNLYDTINTMWIQAVYFYFVVFLYANHRVSRFSMD